MEKHEKDAWRDGEDGREDNAQWVKRKAREAREALAEREGISAVELEERRDRRWVLATGLRILFVLAALAAQLPSVDDWVIFAVNPKANLMEQAALGGTVHYIQAAAFGAACALTAEAVLSVLAHIVLAIGRASKRRRHRPRPQTPPSGIAM